MPRRPARARASRAGARRSDASYGAARHKSPLCRTPGQAGMSRPAARPQADRRPAGTSESAQRPGSRPELAPPCAKQLVFGRLVDRPGGERTHDARDVEEVAVVQVVREDIAPPGTATHRQQNGSALSKLPPVAKQCAWLT